MFKGKTRLRATISYIIVAFLFVLIVLGSVQTVFGSQISEAISLVNMFCATPSDSAAKEAKLDSETNRLQTYPKYATQYASLKIESLNVDLPLYYGDSLTILRNGVGQSLSSYFPGEGGSIICMAHNTKGFLRELQNIQKDAIITITTSYGVFNYKVYDTKIVHQSQVDAVPVQHDEEILMLYTCYPVNSVGHATHRFITYAKLVQGE